MRVMKKNYFPAQLSVATFTSVKNSGNGKINTALLRNVIRLVCILFFF